jgi:hypothetical protein
MRVIDEAELVTVLGSDKLDKRTIDNRANFSIIDNYRCWTPTVTCSSHDSLPVFKPWPSKPHLSFPSTSRLSHIITIYHIYIITIGSNAHSNGLIEASMPRLFRIPPYLLKSKPSKALLHPFGRSLD